MTTKRNLLAGADIETTGLSQPDGHRIIEIALSIYDLDSRTKVGQIAKRFNPQRPIDPDAQAIHGIAFEDLAGEPLWEAEAPKIESLLRQCRYVVAHNGLGFDMPFVYGELLRAGRGLPEVGLVDTMLQARWATPDGSLPSLKALCFACGVDYDTTRAHAAMYDVDVMLQCFFRQHDKGFFQLPLDTYRYTVPKSKAKKEK